MSGADPNEDAWQAEIARRRTAGDGLEFSLAQFGQAVDAVADDEALAAFFEAMVASGDARRIQSHLCPIKTCGGVLSEAAAPHTICPHCLTDYQEEGVEALPVTYFKLEGELSRDIRWMVVIHGMYSRAPWQEEFSWQIANRLRYSAPVLIYKYGWATIDVLTKWSQRRQADKLGNRIRIAIEQAIASKRPARPDVIAHSFGTHLLSLILDDPKFSALSFGRIITAGSIIRPDFDWTRHIASGRVEAVLNHVAAKDGAVPFAQYWIPGAGPGGKAGYAAPGIGNVRASEFEHSTFFEPDTLRELIRDGGLWHNFLTHPPEQFQDESTFTPEQPWKPASWPRRAATRGMGYLVFAALAPLSWLRRRIDP